MNESDAAARPSGGGAAASDLHLARVVREESGTLVATLTRAFDSLDIAEEAVPRRSRRRCARGA